MSRDHRDLVIEESACSEAHLAAECAALRELLHAALDRLHAQHLELTRLRERYRRLLDDMRAHRRAA